MRKIYPYLTFLILALTGQVVRAQEGSFAYGYCSDNINAISFDANDNYWIAGAFQLTEADVEKFDGCEITAVSIGFGSGRNKAVTVFFTDDLKATPFRTVEGRVRPSQWNDIPVEDPVVIRKGKPIYVGYKHQVQNSTAIPLGCDDNTATYSENADWVSAGYTDEELTAGWQHIGSKAGNVCLRVYLKGNRLPKTNCIPQNLQMPDLAHPGQPFDFTLTFSNASTEAVNDIEVIYQIGEDPEHTVTHTFDTPVEANGTGAVTMTGQTLQDAFGLPVWARISKVNGDDNDMADRKTSSILVCSSKFFERKVVSEKYSGVSCGYCPRGLVAYDYMNEKYADKFIGISVSNYSTSDPMYCSYYEKYFDTYSPSGAPSLLVNRNKELTRNADKGSLEAAFLKQFTEGGEIGITAAFEKGDYANTINATGIVEVVFDKEDADMSMTFVVTEDNVGPYLQSNYYSGSTGLPEWTDKASRVSTIYEDVARYIHPDWNGIPGSVPETLKAGEKYAYTVKNMSLGRTDNFNNASLIVLLIDNKTGQIVNADRCRLDKSGVADGIEHLKSEDCQAVEVNGQTVSYQGVGQAEVYAVSGKFEGMIENNGTLKLLPGAYIVKTASTVRKVLVK